MLFKNPIFSIINNYEKTNNISNNYVYRSINKYILLQIVIFTTHFLFNVIEYGFILISKVLLFLILYFILMLSLKKKTYVYGVHINIYSLIAYLILIFSISFLSIHTRQLINIDLYYFPIISSIPFLYNLKEDKPYVLSIIILTLLLMCIPTLIDLDFIIKSELIINKRSNLTFMKITNLLVSFIALFVNLHLVYRKDEYIFKIHSEKETLKEHMHELEGKYLNLMQKQFIINNINTEEIDEIYKLAETNSTLYFDKFCILFPNFKNTLVNINPELNFSELHFCSLIKLNFDTKKIAQILNLTVRAVESKKYRLKRKLNLNTDINIHEFIIKI
ncbi:helix-turn-helix transcriptional regulator [Flavobacterium sp. UBA7663]|uniref:helix-turn-helix transcriptional regulator n=1 Tax=Flavobacterium sp. UBA7663 TaxID=1946557 RepID=UPI0025B90C69|nr:hypothetical protein [Flavobacterium sp. UBA7663]